MFSQIMLVETYNAWMPDWYHEIQKLEEIFLEVDDQLLEIQDVLKDYEIINDEYKMFIHNICIIGERSDKLPSLALHMRNCVDLDNKYNRAALYVIEVDICRMQERVQIMKDVRQFLLSETLDVIEKACDDLISTVERYVEAENKMTKISPRF
jgi:hypothetical protein